MKVSTFVTQCGTKISIGDWIYVLREIESVNKRFEKGDKLEILRINETDRGEIYFRYFDGDEKYEVDSNFIEGLLQTNKVRILKP